MDKKNQLWKIKSKIVFLEFAILFTFQKICCYIDTTVTIQRES